MWHEVVVAKFEILALHTATTRHSRRYHRDLVQILDQCNGKFGFRATKHHE
jgi:hypothetical protein